MEKWKDLQLTLFILWQNFGLRRGRKTYSTFKCINGSFHPGGGNAIKHGNALDGGCLVQTGLEVFHTGLPAELPSYFSSHTCSALSHNSSLLFSNFSSEKQFALASPINILTHHPGCSQESQPPSEAEGG